MKSSLIDPNVSYPEGDETIDSAEKVLAFLAWVKTVEPFIDRSLPRLSRSMLSGFDEGQIADDFKFENILREQNHWWHAYWNSDHGSNVPMPLLGFDPLSFKIFAHRYGVMITPELMPAWWADIPAGYWTA